MDADGHRSPLDRTRHHRTGRRAVVAVATLLALAVAASPAAASTPTATTETAPPAPVTNAIAYDFSAIDARMQQAVTDCAEICGGVLAFERKGSVAGTVDVLMNKKYGNAASVDTVYWTASAAKWISGATVMTVVDRGQISLDATIGQYFPAYAGTVKGTTTLRQLMSHTSGFAKVGDDPACLGDPTTTIAACVDTILAQNQFEPPGTKFRYGGNGMQIAGRMIELATGKPWTQVYRDNVAGPLGLSSTTTYQSSTNPRIAGGSPKNGVKTTSSDYLRFIEMFIGGGRFRGTHVMSQAAIDTMLSDQTNQLPVAYTPIPDMKGYGIGVWIEQVDAQGTGTLFTSPGMFGMQPWYDRARGSGGVLLIQKNMAAGETVIDAVRPLINTQIDSVPAGTAPPGQVAPVITSLSPNKAPAAGGVTITITGSGFSNVTGIRFGPSTWAGSFTVVSSTRIDVVVPARSVGYVNVFVRIGSSTLSTTSNATLFRYT